MARLSTFTNQCFSRHVSNRVNPHVLHVHKTHIFSSVGYPGPTHAGAEPGVAATAPAYPMHSGSAHLVAPPTFAKGKGKSKPRESKFDLFRSLGSLSPWYSVEQGTFGIDSSPEAPDTCRITGVHLLHRHGARYPADVSASKSFTVLPVYLG